MKLRKLFTTTLALAMILTMLPGFSGMTAKADDADDGLVLKKTATLQDDGTYTINLQAYATGKVTTTTTTTTKEEVVPTDIILVLDQSGSMAYDMTGYTTGYSKATGVSNSSINSGSYYYKADGKYYKVTATKELVNSAVKYKGDDGTYYQLSDLANTWTANDNTTVYTTSRYYVKNSLKTFHYGKRTVKISKYISVSVHSYINDNNSEDYSYGFYDWLAAAKYFFNSKYNTSYYSVMIDDKYAAQYIAVTEEEVNQYRYTYTYVNDDGKTVTIGSSDASDTADSETASITLYTQNTSSTTTTRVKALQTAAQEFVDGIRENALENDVDHRVAVVGFGCGSEHNSSSSSYYQNTELFIGETQYNYAVNGKSSTYASTGSIASDHYTDALQSAKTATGYKNLTASIDNLDAEGGTHPNLGFDMANGILSNSSTTYTKSDGTTGTRNRIIVFMTDGTPGESGWDSTVATATESAAETSKNTYGASVSVVEILGTSDTETNDMISYLKTVSSNDSYSKATNGTDLSNFFSSVESTIIGTTTTTTSDVTISKNAWLTDELSEYLTVPEDFSIAKNVTIQTAEHLGNEEFANPVTVSGDSIKANLRMDSSGNTTGIDVSGFDFSASDNWVTTSSNDSGDSSELVVTGKKLIVTITGLLAKDSAAQNLYVDTNSDNSGIWDYDENGDAKEVKAFNKPHTYVANKLYVLDYAKTADLDVYNATKVDDASDQVIGNASNTTLTGNYGNITTSEGLQYTPDTTKWDSYDSFYALGKDSAKGDTKTQNIWSKVSVLPANNVYYEDTFVTDDSTGTVGIEYSGKWTEDKETTYGTNKADTNSDEMGWIESLADSTSKYTDGSAHVSDEAGASATFTFTGTGVDVYSRTKGDVGTILALLYKNDSTSASKVYFIDNESVNGDYYQIPTLSIKNLDYGTYKVVIYVASDSDGHSTYYLDGIRVYNPMKANDSSDDTVKTAYGKVDDDGTVDTELSTAFTEIREALLNASDPDDDNEELCEDTGHVYIDYIPDKEDDGTTSSTADYTDYGPKNEVYLYPRCAIAFKLDDQVVRSSIGMKSPTGEATTVLFTDGDYAKKETISSTSDMYYSVTANSEHIIVVQNTGDNIVSLTKLKYSTGEEAGAVADSSGTAVFSSAKVTALAMAANTLTSLPVVEDEEEEAVSEETEPETTVAEEETTAEEQNTGVVEIKNSDETAADQEKTDEYYVLKKLLKKMLFTKLSAVLK